MECCTSASGAGPRCTGAPAVRDESRGPDRPTAWKMHGDGREVSLSRPPGIGSSHADPTIASGATGLWKPEISPTGKSSGAGSGSGNSERLGCAARPRRPAAKRGKRRRSARSRRKDGRRSNVPPRFPFFVLSPDRFGLLAQEAERFLGPAPHRLFRMLPAQRLRRLLEQAVVSSRRPRPDMLSDVAVGHVLYVFPLAELVEQPVEQGDGRRAGVVRGRAVLN